MRIKPGMIVRHFKGDLYLILDVAMHTEDDYELIVYKALYGDGQIWARPWDMFLSHVPEDKENPTGQKYRFEEYAPKSVSEYQLGD